MTEPFELFVAYNSQLSVMQTALCGVPECSR